jgi:hypothetical protein
VVVFETRSFELVTHHLMEIGKVQLSTTYLHQFLKNRHSIPRYEYLEAASRIGYDSVKSTDTAK